MKQLISPFKRFSPKGLLIILIISSAYLMLSFILIGFKPDQLVLIGIFCSFYYATSISRKLILGFSIFIIYWIVFDYMKAFPNYWVNDVHISDLYQHEKYFFGIKYQGNLLTANEFLFQKQTPFLNAMSGFFYLCWVPVPLLFAAWLFLNRRDQFLKFALTFLWVNVIGFIIYYIYPAAPPWYIHRYGDIFIAQTPGSAAGLERFDNMFHVEIFKSLYAKSSNVFAAMPSLHASYPILVLYYGLKNKLGWINIIFALIMLGIWFSAVYNDHHYVLDILAGIVCAAIAIISFNLVVGNVKWVNRSFENFKRIIE